MRRIPGWTRFFLPFLLLQTFFFATSIESAEGLSRLRYRTVLHTLFSSNDEKDPISRTRMKRLWVLSESLVQEGGYLPESLAMLWGKDDPDVEAVACIVRQLDRCQGRSSRRATEAPSPFLVAVPITLAYLKSPDDGRAAAAHCARLASDDLDAEDIGRATFDLLTAGLKGEKDRGCILESATRHLEDPSLGCDLRGVRLLTWRKLKDESTARGQLQRVLFVWFRSKTLEETREASRSLEKEDARLLLDVIIAAFYPPEAVLRSCCPQRGGGKLDALCLDLYELATSGALLPVKRHHSSPQEAPLPSQDVPQDSDAIPPPSPLPSHPLACPRGERCRLFGITHLPTPSLRPIPKRPLSSFSSVEEFSDAEHDILDNSTAPLSP